MADGKDVFIADGGKGLRMNSRGTVKERRREGVPERRDELNIVRYVGSGGGGGYNFRRDIRHVRIFAS